MLKEDRRGRCASSEYHRKERRQGDWSRASNLLPNRNRDHLHLSTVVESVLNVYSVLNRSEVLGAELFNTQHQVDCDLSGALLIQTIRYDSI